MDRRVVIITRASPNAIFEGVNVYFEQVGRSLPVGAAVYLKCCLTVVVGSSVWSV